VGYVVVIVVVVVMMMIVMMMMMMIIIRRSWSLFCDRSIACSEADSTENVI